MLKILIVENERVAAKDLAGILTDLGHEVVAMASNFDDARAYCSEYEPDLALLDIQIDGDRDGVSLAAELREDFSLAIAFITSRADHRTIQQASATHPNGYLVKPFAPSTVDALVTVAMSNYSAEHNSVDVEGLSETRNSSDKGLTDDQLQKVRDFIDQNLDGAIKIEDLADKVGLTEQVFAKRFQQSQGTSPYQYLISARVDEGKRLLRNTTWKLSEIALAVGFSSQAHFTTSFRKAVGVTPSAYRNATK